MTLESNYKKLLEEIPKGVQLIVVTKGQSVETIEEVYALGHRDFGESRVRDAFEKMEKLPKDVRWHFIGNLQRNKVSKVIPGFCLIHSVDSFELAKKISEVSVKKGVATKVLLEVNTSKEPSKAGLSEREWKNCFFEVIRLPFLKVEGLMTMAPLTSEKSVVRKCFSNLRRLKEELEVMGKIKLPHLSMGMSQDYQTAIEEGATLLRIGSKIFNV